MIHQALNYTHSGSMNYNGFGDQDEAMKEILKKHPETILITGHIHNPFGTVEIMDSLYGTLVDVPVFTSKGLGYEVYVYDTEAVFRARNYSTQEWLPDYDAIIELDTLPSLAARTESLNEEDYAAASWAEAYPKLETLKSSAQEIQNLTFGSFGSQSRFDINVLQKQYVNAFALLKEKPDINYSRLQTAVDAANSREQAGDLDGLDSIVQDEFRAALAA